MHAYVTMGDICFRLETQPLATADYELRLGVRACVRTSVASLGARC